MTGDRARMPVHTTTASSVPPPPVLRSHLAVHQRSAAVDTVDMRVHT
jgi:hypothetical protein